MSATLAALFASGHAVDLVLAVLGVEALWLTWRGRTGVLPALLPAVPLLLATRAALTGEPWYLAAGWLALSLPAHLYDLQRRLSPSASSGKQ